jgi:hypothetical protein
MSKTLYDEAIAEAKLLQETAEQNAKNAIIEAVTPRIREFIEEQLLGESSQKSDSDILETVASDFVGESEDIILDESALSALLEKFGGVDQSASSGDEYRSALNEAFHSLSDENKKKLSKIVNNLSESGINIDKNQQESSNMSRDDILYEVNLDDLSSLLGEGKHKDQLEAVLDDVGEVNMYERMDDQDMEEAGHEMHERMDDQDMEEAMADMTMDEIMSLLGDELLNEDVIELDLGDEVIPPELADALSRSGVSVRPSEDAEGDVEAAADDGEADMDMDMDMDMDLPPMDAPEGGEESLDEVFEIDENLLRTELRRLYQSGALSEAKELIKMKGIKNDMEHHFGGKGSGKVGTKGAYGGTGGSKSGVSGAYGGGKESGDPLKVTLNKLSEAIKKERLQNRSLRGRLSEYRSAVETLREQLTDLNLFNAKLLYVNKLLQDKTVTSSRKQSIVEAIDNAKTLREVKLLYKGLTRAEPGNLNENAAKKAVGSSSRPTGRSSSTSATAEVDRWSILAGLK